MDEYIKRETLLSIYKKWLPQLESKEDEGDRRGVETCIAVLEDLTAEDVAPVVHGRWIKTVQENGCAEWTDFTCSVCGAVFDDNEWLFDEWKGCPVCLARMDL